MNGPSGPDLSGRRALVTGAASGIGAAVAARLADLGAHVIVCDVNAEGAARTAKQIGGSALVIDLSRTGALAERRLEVDILVNNAGIQHVAPVEQFEPEQFVGLSKVIALEGAAKGVTSNCVCPGYVRTPLVENQLADQAAVHGLSPDEVISNVLLTRSAVKRLIEPQEIAGAVAFLCSPEASSLSGTELILDGAWSAS